MGFAEGFAAGSAGLRGAIQMAYDKERQDKLLAIQQAQADREAQEFAWRQQDRQRLDDAYANYGRTTLGLTPDQQQQIQSTYGMTPAQVGQAASAGPGALQARLASYDPPDSFDGMGQYVGLAPAPAAPAVTASSLNIQAPTGAAADLAREQALEGIGVASRDPNAIRASALAQRQLHMSLIAANAMKTPLKDIESQLPQLNTPQSGYPMLYLGKGKNGYQFLTTGADGTPGNQFTMNESQVRQLFLAHSLADAGYGTEAMQTLEAAHKDIGEHVKNWNDALTRTATTNNTATHDANQDVNDATRARASMISANASASSAGALSRYYGTRAAIDQQELDSNKEARALAAQYEALSPEDQRGPAGQALVRKFNILNAKPGGVIRPDTAAAGRMPQTLTDAEKIGYTKALDEISMIPPNQMDSVKVAQIYRKYGLDPARFGVQGLPSWGQAPGASAAQSGAQGTLGIQVPGRPYYNAKTSDLQRIAERPKGVSPAEAAAAQDELARRKGEDRLGTF